MERLALVAKLKDGAAARAAEVVRHGPPFDPGELGFSRHAVYLTGEHAIFIFEGDAADASVQELLAERLRSPAFAQWAALLEGVPEPAPEGYYWKKTG